MKYLIVVFSLVYGLQTANAEEVVLTKNNHCSLEGSVNKESVQKAQFCLADQVIKRAGRNYPLYLVINSPGGSIYAGLRFIDFAKTIKNLQTVTIFGASMASAIAEALPGKRHVTESGVMMFHRASGTFKGQFEDGELESRLRLWKKIVRKMEETNAKRIGITLAEYKVKRKDEWWLYGEENVNENTADVVSVVKCSTALLKDRKKETINTIFGEYIVETSACPLTN
jgi:ATP-dependent protease ClpP protease subunit